jgi:hypothetical protein
MVAARHDRCPGSVPGTTRHVPYGISQIFCPLPTEFRSWKLFGVQSPPL